MRNLVILMVIKSILSATALVYRPPVQLNVEADVLKIAFGSCVGILSTDTSIFDTIASYDPAMWAWIGDATYLDLARGGITPRRVTEEFQKTADIQGYREMR